jgi:hypothetical protein
VRELSHSISIFPVSLLQRAMGSSSAQQVVLAHTMNLNVHIHQLSVLSHPIWSSISM